MAEREWILLNPGPANTSGRVRQALQTPDLCHREPEFFEVMRECRQRLVGVLGIERTFSAVLFTGSGTAAVEAALTSVVPTERSVLVIDNGVYGDRMLRICRAARITAETLRYDFTTPVSPADVARRLREHPEISHVAVVHHETTTGLLNPVEALADVAAAAGRRLIVDATSSLFGEPLERRPRGHRLRHRQRQQVPAGDPRHLVRARASHGAGGPRRTRGPHRLSRRAPALGDPGARQHPVHAGRPGAARHARGADRARGRGRARSDRALRRELPRAATRNGRRSASRSWCRRARARPSSRRSGSSPD